MSAQCTLCLALLSEKLTAEQEAVALEKSFIVLRTHGELLATEVTALKQALSDTLRTLSDELSFARLSQRGSLEQVEASDLHRANQAREHLVLNEHNARLQQQCDGLSEQLGTQEQRLSLITVRALASEQRLSECEGRLAQQQFHTQQLQQERELAVSHAQFLDTDRVQRKDEWRLQRSDLEQRLATLQQSFASQQRELDLAKTAQSTTQTQFSSAQAALEQTSAKLRDQEQARAQERSSDARELQTQTRLAELYKKSAMEERGRSQAVEKTLLHLQESVSVLHGTHEERMGSMESEATKLHQERDMARNAMEELKLQCAESNRKLEEAHALMHDGFDATSQLLQPPEDFSSVEIYTRYMSATDLLRRERCEKQRLVQSCVHLEQQCVVAAQLTQHDRAQLLVLQQSHSQLLGRLQSATDKLCELDSSRASLLASNTLCGRLRQEAVDLAQQVRQLLYRSTPAIQAQEMVLAEGDVNDANRVISQHLVSFNNIDELQQRNQELLSVVRQLSEDREHEKEKLRAECEADFERRESEALQQLKQMRELLQRQEERTQAAMLQISQHTLIKGVGSAHPTNPDISSSETSMVLVDTITVDPRTADTELISMRQALVDCRHSLQNSERELGDLRTERSENDRRLTQAAEAARVETARVQVIAARSEAELEYVRQRLQQATVASDGYRGEHQQMQKKLAECSAGLILQEQHAGRMLIEVQTGRHELNRLQNELQQVNVEKRLLAQTESRLSEENSKLVLMQDRQERLVANLSAMQTALEQKEGDSRGRLVEERDRFEHAALDLKRQLDTDRLSHRDSERLLVQARIDLQGRVQKLDVAAGEQREQALRAEQKHQQQQHQIEMQQQIRTTEQQELDRLKLQLASLLAAQQSPAQVRCQRLEQDLAAAQLEHQRLTEAATAAESHCGELRRLALEADEALRTLRQSSEQYTQHSQQQLAQQHQQIAALESRVQELSRQSLSAELALDHMRISSAAELVALQQQLTQSLGLEQEQRQRAEELEKRVFQLQEDVRSQMRVAADSQQRYHAELGQHASTVQQFQKCQRDIGELGERERGALLAVGALEARLGTAQHQAVTQRQMLETQMTALSGRSAELLRQNQLLLAQIELLSHRVQEVCIRPNENEGEPTIDTTSDTPIDGVLLSEPTVLLPAQSMSTIQLKEQALAMNNLREIVRFLRSEKEISELEFERISLQASKMKQEADVSAVVLRDLRSELAAVNIRLASFISSNATVTTDSTSVTTTIDNRQLLLLQDSNVRLRDEAQRVRLRVVEMERLVQQREREIEPMARQIRMAEADKEAWSLERDALRLEATRWKERTEQVLTKYHQIDPVVHHQLQLTLDQLRIENTTLETRLQQTQPLYEQLARTQSELKMEKELIVKLQGEIARLNSSYDVLKKRLEENSKQRVDSTAMGRIKNAEEGKTRVDAQLEDVRTQAQSRIEKMIKLLQEARMLIKRRSDECNAKTISVVEFEKQIHLLRADLASSHSKHAADSETIRNAYELRLTTVGLELKAAALQLAVSEKKLQSVQATDIVVVKKPVANAIASIATSAGATRSLAAVVHVIPVSPIHMPATQTPSDMSCAAVSPPITITEASMHMSAPLTVTTVELPSATNLLPRLKSVIKKSTIDANITVGPNTSASISSTTNVDSSAETPLTSKQRTAAATKQLSAKTVTLIPMTTTSVPISGKPTAVIAKTPTAAVAKQSPSVVTLAMPAPAITAPSSVPASEMVSGLEVKPLRALRIRASDSISSASIAPISGTNIGATSVLSDGVETAGGDTTRPTKKAKPLPLAVAAVPISTHPAVALNSAMPINHVLTATPVITITPHLVPVTPAVIHNETTHTGIVSCHATVVSTKISTLLQPVAAESIAPITIVTLEQEEGELDEGSTMSMEVEAFLPDTVLGVSGKLDQPTTPVPTEIVSPIDIASVAIIMPITSASVEATDSEHPQVPEVTVVPISVNSTDTEMRLEFETETESAAKIEESEIDVIAPGKEDSGSTVTVEDIGINPSLLYEASGEVVESIALESVETAVSDALSATSVSGTIDILTVIEDIIDSTYGTEKTETEVLAESDVPCDTSIDVADLDAEMSAEAAHPLEENVSELEASLVVLEDDIASANEDPADSAEVIDPETLQESDNTMIGTAPTESSEDTEISTTVGVESSVDAAILDSAAMLNANENQSLTESAEIDESIADVGLSGQYSTSELESGTVLEDAPDLNRETEKDVELLSVAEEQLNMTATADQEAAVDRDQLEYVDGASSAASTVPVTEPDDRNEDAEIPHDVDVSEIDIGDAGPVDDDFSVAETAETDEVPQDADETDALDLEATGDTEVIPSGGTTSASFDTLLSSRKLKVHRS